MLIDTLLNEGSTPRWNPQTGYGINLPQLPIRQGIRTTDDWQRAIVNKSVILKLHGSLNWGVREVEYEDGTKPLELSSKGSTDNSENPLAPISRRIDEASGNFGAPHHWIPFIIPPVGVKNEFYLHPAMVNIWHLARHLLQTSKNIHILGYSFPKGDIAVDTLLRESLYWGQGLTDRREVHIIDKSKEVRERLKVDYGFGKVKIAFPKNDIVEYIRQLCKS